MPKEEKLSRCRYWPCFLLLFILAGCGSYEEPEFDRINELKVHKISKDYITLNVIYKEKNIANISNIAKTKVRAKKEFEIPFTVKVPTEEFKNNVLTDLLGFLNGKKVNLDFNGILTVSKFGINKNVPIDYSKTVRLKL